MRLVLQITMCGLLGWGLSPEVTVAQTDALPLTLQEAGGLAISTDPWLSGSEYREQALAYEAISAATLPDPTVSLAAANFAADSVDINQEPMTQLLVGVTQMFPRGDTLALSGKQKREMAAQEPLLRQDRQASVRSRVEQLWLQAYEAQQAVALIDGERALFEQLVDAARARYVSVVGSTQQQDLIRAQLALSRLDDRLTGLTQQRQQAQRRLSEWIGVRALADLAENSLEPSLPLSDAQLKLISQNPQTAFEHVSLHPQLLALEQRVAALDTGVALAEQAYAPQWGLSASYGYRDEDQLGRDRADLFSVGVSFDLPLFTANRQDKAVMAAAARVAALKTEKQLKARELVANLQETAVALTRLQDRVQLFDATLLPQMSAQSESSLTAYNNDNGSFSDAVEARIAELNTKIERLGIAIARRQRISGLNYLLVAGQSMAVPEGDN